MPLTYFLIFVVISITSSLCAALLRSHVILVIASLNMSISGAVLLLAIEASAFDKPDAVVQGAIVIALSSLITLIFCGAIILAFRSRGRLRMDDYRDLRG